MSRYIAVFVILILIMGAVPLNWWLFKQNASALDPSVRKHLKDPLWEEVEKAIIDRLPKTVIEKCREIRQKAFAEGRIGEALRALIEEYSQQAYIEGRSNVELIKSLRKEVESADENSRFVLEALLAKVYWNYYLENRWQFSQRTATAAGSLDRENFETWDLKTIFNEIDRLYRSALSEEEKLKNIAISMMDGFLEPGNTPDEIRPTLFDFVANKALEFYTSGEQAGLAAEDAFEIDGGSAAFGPLEEFLKYDPETSDTGSTKLMALKLYQKLISFHRERNETDAMLDADINRLIFVRDNATGSNYSENFKKRMQEIFNNYRDSSYSSLAAYYLARELYNQGQYTEAHRIATEGRNLHPDSTGAQNCSSLIIEIERKELAVTAEQVFRPGKAVIDVAYRNIDSVSFRLLKENWEKQQEDRESFFYSDDYIKRLLAREPAYEWTVSLEETADYKTKHRAVETPELEKGYYILLASYKSDFSRENNCIQVARLWVSKLAIVPRARNGRLEGFVLDSESGEPLSDVSVMIYVADESADRMRKKARLKTNADGFFEYSFGEITFYREPHIRVSNEGDELVVSCRPPWKRGEEGTSTHAVLFTDRALYRPGQMINFKGIVFKKNTQENLYEVVKNHSFSVHFRDVNWQEIKSIQVTTNEFGAFSGTFVAPSDRLTGRMTLETPYGLTQINVEEYKRPKFTVEVKVPEEAFALGEKVRVRGVATAYTGAPVDSAKVRYRVTREVRFPYWCWWCPPPSGGQEIGHGTLKTDSEGKFEIEFVAKPDELIDPATDPKFTFKVNVDVTDSSGETRSDDASIVLGYTALEATITAGNWLPAKEPVTLTLRTTTLDGTPAPSKGTIKIFSLKQPARPSRTGFYYRAPGEPDPSNWETWEDDKLISEEKYSIEKDEPFKLQKNFEPGPYRARVETMDKNGKKVVAHANFMVIDPEGKVFPVRVPSIVLPKKTTWEVGEKLEILWGTGYELGKACIEIEHDDEIIQKYWTDREVTQNLITLDITEAHRGGFAVHITYVRENRNYSQTIPVNVPWTNKELKLKFETFRSKLRPGEKETWKIKIEGPDAERKACEMVAALYDSSLDAYYPHDWIHGFNFFKTWNTTVDRRFSNSPLTLSYIISNWERYVAVTERTYRDFPNTIMLSDYYGGLKIMRKVSRRDGGMDDGMEYLRMEDAMMLSECADTRAMSPAKALAPPPCPSALPEAGGPPEGAKEKDSGQGGGAGSDEQVAKPKIDLSKVSARKNLNETAFFYPHLTSDENGIVTINFEMPEALTKWKFLGFAHNQDMQSGYISDYTVTQKELMVEPNPPRFVREGDVLEFPVKITNMTEAPMKGISKLEFFDAATDRPLNKLLGLEEEQANNSGESDSPGVEQSFELAPKQSKTLFWKITVPDGLQPLRYKVVGGTEEFSDGQEGYLPVLTGRIFVTEQLPLWIRGPAEKNFKFQKLIDSGSSNTLKHHRLVVQMTSNPAWLAVQALPYLMEFPHECSEQLFNRYYANMIGKTIVDSNPRIEEIFKQWKATNAGALKSNLQKNEDLKNVLLMETPWVLEAKNEQEARERIAMFFDRNRLENEMKTAMKKLRNQQMGSGAWPWFPGGRESEWITLYIVQGFGRLKHFDINTDLEPARKAISYLDNWYINEYREAQRWNPESNHLHYMIIQYLYTRSFFLDDCPMSGSELKKAHAYFMEQARKYWADNDSLMCQAMLALGMSRFGDREIPARIVASLRERAKNEEEMGMFWKTHDRWWYWYGAPIETQAMMIELFDEVAKDKKAVEDMKVWLLKQKQTTSWKTTKATSDAIYALLSRGTDLLASTIPVEVSLGEEQVKPEKIEAGTGYYEKRYEAAEVKASMGDIKVRKEDEGIAWGGVFWQYFEDMTKVTPHETNLSLKKRLFVKRDTKAGPVLEPVPETATGPNAIPAQLKVGDCVVVRIELKTDRDLEYVHMKDCRATGLEPVDVISQYKWQDGLGYYQSTKDTATHFFIDYIRPGQYVFEYELRVQHKGEYQTGIAEIQCMYAPEFGSHSESFKLTVSD